jgi:hypothetical protein
MMLPKNIRLFQSTSDRTLFSITDSIAKSRQTKLIKIKVLLNRTFVFIRLPSKEQSIIIETPMY